MSSFWWVDHLTQEVTIPEVRNMRHICVFLGDWPDSHISMQRWSTEMLTTIQVCQHAVKLLAASRVSG